ncbi:oligosaccharide flippase family protein [Leisingera sp. ANG-M6]|uniref:oligosaccharide flippase family protein n=1 Tax=Leisingera sp. ANG-M6 TaxID=1577900 RepID=UPI0005839EEC|nr:oligosaccharide flippase family protein [Leisingera sp. ANG-M6]KIC27522.1 hypothetical protein RA24_14915 [Leisingera sp. ANG-M6]
MKPRGLLRNGAVMGSGVLASQAIGILSYPVLSRLFSPEDFGTFALFFFGMQVLGASLAGRYEQAIMLCRSQARARHTLQLAQATALAAALALVLLSGLFRHQLDAWSGASLGAAWMAVPAAGFFVSVQTSLSFMAVRLGRFGAVSAARVVKPAAAFALQVALAYALWGGTGALIAGETLGAALSILPVLRAGGKGPVLWRSARGRRYAGRLARFYASQPLWNLPHVFVNQVSRWIMAALITALYSAAEAGAYFMMFRVVMMPSTLVSGALSQVFFRSAAEEQRQAGSFRGALKATAAPLLGIGALTAAVLVLFGPDLFVLVLGPQWQPAGLMAAVFAPYIVLQMVLATVAPCYLLAGRQKAMLAVACGQTAVFLGGFLLGHWGGGSMFRALGTSVWLSVPYMTAMLFWYWRLAASRNASQKEAG